jgi:hypothetical protein
MNRKVLLTLSILTVLFFAANAFGAIFTIEAENLPNPSEIESITFFFDVGFDFEYVTDSLALGADIPANSPGDTLWPWTFANLNPDVDSGIFTVDMYNGDAFDFTPIAGLANGEYNVNNLVDGILATFEYTGTISLGNFVVANSIGDAISYELIDTETPGGVAVSPVPIPPALLLFGSGIIGMLGLRRKFNK